MNRYFSGLAAACAVSLTLAATPASAGPERYELDPDHTSIGFMAMHIGYAKTLGMFLESEGSFTFDEEALTLSDVEIIVETESVFTNHKKRDQHLTSPDFLNAGEFPEMIFRSTSSEKLTDTTGIVHGELELLGQTHPLSLEVTYNKAGPYPFGDNYVVGVSARGTVIRSQYGMTYAVDNGWVGDEIELLLELEAIRQ